MSGFKFVQTGTGYEVYSNNKKIGEIEPMRDGGYYCFSTGGIGIGRHGKTKDQAAYKILKYIEEKKK